MPEKKKGMLQGWLDSTDSQRDVTLAAFAAVVIFGIVALSVDWRQNRSLSSNWVQAFWVLAGMVALGGPARAAVDAWKSRSGNAPQAPKPGEGDQT